MTFGRGTETLKAKRRTERRVMSVRGPSPRLLVRVEPPDAFDDGGDFLRGGLQRTRFEHK